MSYKQECLQWKLLAQARWKRIKELEVALDKAITCILEERNKKSEPQGGNSG